MRNDRAVLGCNLGLPYLALNPITSPSSSLYIVPQNDVVSIFFSMPATLTKLSVVLVLSLLKTNKFRAGVPMTSPLSARLSEDMEI